LPLEADQAKKLKSFHFKQIAPRSKKLPLDADRAKKLKSCHLKQIAQRKR
jgi:hypothetical protein